MKTKAKRKLLDLGVRDIEVKVRRLDVQIIVGLECKYSKVEGVDEKVTILMLPRT